MSGNHFSFVTLYLQATKGARKCKRKLQRVFRLFHSAHRDLALFRHYNLSSQQNNNWKRCRHSILVNLRSSTIRQLSLFQQREKTLVNDNRCNGGGKCKSQFYCK